MCSLIVAEKANMVTMTKLEPITKYYSKHADNQNREINCLPAIRTGNLPGDCSALPARHDDV